MDINNVRHKIEEDVFPTRALALSRGFATKNYSIGMHDHSFYEINIVFEGRGAHYIEGEMFEAKPGDVFVIPPSVIHGYESHTDSFNVYHLILKDAFFEKYGDDLKNLNGYNLLFEIEPYLRARASAFYLNLDYNALSELEGDMKIFTDLKSDTSPSADVTRNLRSLSIILRLCEIMHESSKDETAKGRRDFLPISKSLEYIHTSYSEKISIDTLAMLSNMSRSTFLRRFKEICATTPLEYLNGYRTTLARRMLLYGESKTSVAQKCGFYDLSHLEKNLMKYKSTVE